MEMNEILSKNSTNFWRFVQNNKNIAIDEALAIFEANSQVSVVKNYESWNNLDRPILRGQKAIKYNYNGQRKRVFDLKQTHGKPYTRYNYPTKNYLVGAIEQLCLEIPPQYSGNFSEDLEILVSQYAKEKKIAVSKKIIEDTTGALISIIGEKSESNINNVEELRKVETIIKNIYYEIESKEIKGYEYRTRKGKQATSERTRNDRGDIGSGSIKLDTVSSPPRKIRQSSIRNDERVQQYSLFETVYGTEDNSVSEEDRTTSERNERNIVDTNATEDNRELLGQLSEVETSGTSDRRNNIERDNRTPNFAIRGEVERGGAKGRYKDNIEAIRLIKKLKKDDTQAIPEQQEVLARYCGWGGLPQAFDENNESWSKEYVELKELLTEDEYRSARGSTLSAHYTSSEIISSIYEGLKQIGLTTGKVLEPACGIGNFIGAIPDTFDKSKIYGVELDSLTGNIAKQLYPESRIQIKGFEETNFKNNSFDALITNVPFGAFKVYDRAYNNLDFFIHDYFIAKGLDKVRPNGILTVITSKGTLDKTNSKARQYFANRAELLGAIRLPNTAFKKNANTEVTSDILFFKKREKQVEATDDWIYVGKNTEDIILNQYFIDNPKMMLGKLIQAPSMYGGDNETTLIPDERELKEALHEAMQLLPKNIYKGKETSNVESVVEEVVEIDYNLKNYSFKVIGNDIYQRQNDDMVKIELQGKKKDTLKGMVSLREEVRTILNLQLEDCTDEELKLHQDSLNKLYDNFIKKYGCINTRNNISLFREDSDSALLCGIEKYDEKNQTADKGDIFSKRTISKHKIVNYCETAQEALAVVMSEYGKVNIHEIERLTNSTFETIIKELQGFIYRNPKATLDNKDKYDGWEVAEQYLSGNVKKKIKLAKIVVKEDSSYAENIKALEKIIPEDIQAEDIFVKIGSPWIDTKIYEDYIAEKFCVPYYYRDEISVSYNGFTGEWDIKAPSNYLNYTQSRQTFGTARMPGQKIFKHCLNQQTVNVYDEDAQGKKYLNKEETAIARERQKALQADFKDWIFEKENRRNYLVKKYNEIYNTDVLPNYDGSYLTFPEQNNEITLMKHQVDAVHRIITNGNTLLHHCVGAGKTYTIATASMKLKQLGLAQKPMIVVPNHLVKQWANEFNTLYPNASVLMATKEDFTKENRLKFVSKVATGDWDAVVIGASSFERIPLSKERQQKKIMQEIEKIRSAIIDAKNEDNRISIKNLERTLKNKEAMFKKLIEAPVKDDLLKFEELGVDYLFVDEAHYYKNKGVFTKMNNVAGINTTTSQRALDMDMKCEYINEVQGGQKGVVFATGTPISNSMTEMFVMQSYLSRDVLKEKNIDYFDNWSANFGETVTALELATSGNGYRSKTRFAKFSNLPELLKLYRNFADVQTADMLKLPVPEVEKHLIKTKATEQTITYNEEIGERADDINSGGVDPTIDNMLKITTDGKKLALDPRLYNSNAVDEPDNKINACVENLYSIWEKTKDIKGAQLVFCDLSTPKKSYETYNPEVDFDVYNDIKTKLVSRGVPAEEVRYIHEAGTSEDKKQALFDEVNKGNIRVFLGSTVKCGAGTNIQHKLVAEHHLDTPYRPADLEQREGRIIRQGNENKKVDIFTYVTEKTFDSYSYQILENKQRFISQINKGSLSMREAEDIDDTALNYAQIKSLVTDNPLIKRQMELKQEVSQLETLKSAFNREKWNLQRKLKDLSENNAIRSEKLINVDEDIKLMQANPIGEFSIKIGNKNYAERKEAGANLLDLINATEEGTYLGNYRGFSIINKAPSFLGQVLIKLKGNTNSVYEIELSDSEVGSIIKIENLINKGLEDIKLKQTQAIEKNSEDMKGIESSIAKPFEYTDKIKDLKEELNSIEIKLDLDKKQEIIIDDNIAIESEEKNKPSKELLNLMPEKKINKIIKDDYEAEL